MERLSDINVLNLYNTNPLEFIDEANGDYLGDDGLAYCGKCHTAKVAYFKFENERIIIPSCCKCRSDKLRELRLKEELSKYNLVVSQIKEGAFDDLKLYNWTFDNDDGSCENIDIAKNYVENFNEMHNKNIGLLLSGGVGTGKTYIAAAIANALIEKGNNVIMTNFSTILNDMMNLQINKNAYIKRLNEQKLLIIDDFGMERTTAFANEHIFNIIDSRYRNNQPLIITTNLSLEDFVKANDIPQKRIYSRIIEMCSPIIFKGRCIRNDKMKEKMNTIKKRLYREDL